MAGTAEKRKFTVEGVGDLFVGIPTADDIRGADWEYSRVYSKALMEGLATSGEMVEILKKRGIVGETHDRKVEDVRDKIGQKIVEMELTSDRDARRKLALEVSSLREELFQLNQKVNGPMGNTCEQIAEDARVEYLTANLIQDGSGKKMWDNFDSYKLEQNRALAFQSRFEVMLFLQGLDPDFLDKTPERIVLRELAEQDKAKLKVEDVEDSVESTPAAEEKPKPARKKKAKA